MEIRATLLAGSDGSHARPCELSTSRPNRKIMPGEVGFDVELERSQDELLHCTMEQANVSWTLLPGVRFNRSAGTIPQNPEQCLRAFR
jgi:hypothetical protein